VIRANAAGAYAILVKKIEDLREASAALINATPSGASDLYRAGFARVSTSNAAVKVPAIASIPADRRQAHRWQRRGLSLRLARQGINNRFIGHATYQDGPTNGHPQTIRGIALLAATDLNDIEYSLWSRADHCTDGFFASVTDLRAHVGTERTNYDVRLSGRRP
jgi:hypothetical protein